MNTEINLLSDNELDAVAGGMMKITTDVVPTGGPRSGGGGDGAGKAALAFALGGFWGLAADLAGLF